MSKIRSPAIIAQPEAPSAAREWDKTRNHYARLGLCNRCAAQAAYAHADGWVNVHPPCPACVPTVGTFPMDQANGWRSNGRRIGKR